MRYTSKSIKTVLSEHQDELFALSASIHTFSQLKKKVNELLDSEDLKENKSVTDAKLVFQNCSNHYNRYLSTLMTYMTGMKVSF